MRPGGVAAAGEPVAVQKRTSKGTWVTVARATAAPDGTWATNVAWRRSGQVRARAGGTSSKVASVAVVAVVKLRTPRSRRVPAGGLLRVSGRVRPGQPVRVLVGYAAGSSTDIVGRVMADRLAAYWKQGVYVETRAGAAGNLAADAAAMYAELENSDLREEIARLERKLDAAKPAGKGRGQQAKGSTHGDL